jgi:hypothetical protein
MMAGPSVEGIKSEVQRQVTEFLVEPLCELFDELYATAQQRDGRLLTFQLMLKDIQFWSAVTVSKWVGKALKACDCFDELVTALFLSHIKLLSAIRLSAATLQVKVPRSEKFIHAVMIAAAKDFYENPMIFRTRARDDKVRILSYAVNKTARDMLPLKALLQEYLAQRPEPEGDPDGVEDMVVVRPATDLPQHEEQQPAMVSSAAVDETGRQLGHDYDETGSQLGHDQQELDFHGGYEEDQHGHELVAEDSSRQHYSPAAPGHTEPLAAFQEEIKSIDLGDLPASLLQHKSLLQEDADVPADSHDTLKFASATPPTAQDPPPAVKVDNEEGLLDDILVNHPATDTAPTLQPPRHAPAFFNDASM